MINFDQLKDLLVTHLKVDADLVTPEATLDDIELDSLGAVELSMHLDQQYDIEVPEDDLLGAETVTGMLQLITQGGATPA
jgi:acyl carrier protein